MPKTFKDLDKIFRDADTCDKELFAEQRSNVLLIAGDHYAKKQSRFWSRVRDTNELVRESKLRLTQNHIQKIVKGYVNNIISLAPGVMAGPKNENELRDQKAAELNQAVWIDWKGRNNWKKRRREFIEDFVGIGEIFAKVFFDPNAGTFLGYDADTGQPVFSGTIICERFHAFNVLRDAKAKSMDDSRVLIPRKMADAEDIRSAVKALYSEQPALLEEKLSFIEESMDETFKVFDAQTGQYDDSVRGQLMYREYYFRPCAEYPTGYYFHTTSKGILFEGELPEGEYPIKYEGFDQIPTHPRARSIVKVCRPYQAEINRASSKMAEHQITLGDDKVLTQKGTKLEPGPVMPGIRHYTYTGMEPTIMAGRTGAQYLEYLSAKIGEMYSAASYDEDADKVDSGQVDAYTALYKSMRHKKRFALYAEKIENFERSICESVLRLSKAYLPDDAIVPAVGRPEAINIPEFKSTEDLRYQITIEPVSDDIETKLGKQLSLNHMLQYVGPQLGKDDIGKIMRNMPFANLDQSFNDLTIDYDNATNLILALDRGEEPYVSRNDDPKYMARRLLHRMRQADFSLMPNPVKQNYARYLATYQQIEIEHQQALQRQQSGFIPTTGPFIKITNFLEPDPADATKTIQVALPLDALRWVKSALDEQGTTTQAFDQLPEPVQASIANQAVSGEGPMGAMPMNLPRGMA